jgi:3-phosphoshikimate 1-carboxyvinyltransferase
MNLIVNTSTLNGEITIPGSKSHTIRALVIATLAKGISKIYRPLVSADTLSCLKGCEALGANYKKQEDYWQVEGVAGHPNLPQDIIDVGNSGTTLNFLIGAASLVDGYTIFTGDDQIKRRPVQPLLDALNMLGVEAHSTPQTGCPPLVVKGILKGGYTEVKGSISQPLSSLLINCPLALNETELNVIDLREKPYIEMTLGWLDKQQIQYDRTNLEHFWIKGNQSFKAFTETIPADFSSATFFFCAAAIPGCNIVLKGLDFNDTQGDKNVVDVLRAMGADIHLTDQGLHIRGTQLKGMEIDLADMPDALPALSVVGCLAQGTTQIRNVAHARVKETDRIAIMSRGLKAMGADISELPDGLTVKTSRLTGHSVQSYKDHRVAMALAIAGLAAQGTTTIKDADAIGITFPQFPQLLRQLGASVEIRDMEPV